MKRDLHTAWLPLADELIVVHASKGMTRGEYEDARGWIPAIALPAFEALERGGIVGSAVIVDCVSDSTSPWFRGRWGFVLRDPRPLTFQPYRGQLGFFDVPDSPPC